MYYNTCTSINHMYIKVRVIAGARKEEVTEKGPDSFVFKLKEPAERNLANKRVLEILRERYPNREVKIINGHHSPAKLISIDDKE